MAILNYTTGIDSDKTISEIEKCLVKHGAQKVVKDYNGTIRIAVTFSLPINGIPVAFCLPANYAGVLKAMRNDRKVPRSSCNDEQALRVSWRIVKVWEEAQMAIVEAELADMAEVFLPYAVTPGGTTLYRQIKESGMKMLKQA